MGMAGEETLFGALRLSLMTESQDAMRVSISAARGIAEVIKTSLGPRAMNKMMVDPFGKVQILQIQMCLTEDGNQVFTDRSQSQTTAPLSFDSSTCNILLERYSSKCQRHRSEKWATVPPAWFS